MSPQHQIIVKDKQGNQIGQISNYFNLNFSDQLNNYGKASFDIPVDSDDAFNLISLRRYEIDIYENGIVVWSGEQVLEDETLEANSANLVTITCYTYPEMLNSMYTDEYIRRDQIDQAAMLKLLVDIFQGRLNGDFGFTFAPIVTTKLRDREYQLDNVLEAYINMSNVIDGVDFWIDDKKVIRFGDPKRGIDKSNQFTFEWGVNVFRMKRSVNFSTPATKAYAIGSSDGINPLIKSYSDLAAQDTYGLREQTVSDITVSEEDTLVGKAQDLVNSNKKARQTVKISQIPNTIPDLTQLQIGDSITVKIKKGRVDIDQKFRVLGYECKIGNVGESNIDWILNEI